MSKEADELLDFAFEAAATDKAPAYVEWALSPRFALANSLAAVIPRIRKEVQMGVANDLRRLADMNQLPNVSEALRVVASHLEKRP